MSDASSAELQEDEQCPLLKWAPWAEKFGVLEVVEQNGARFAHISEDGWLHFMDRSAVLIPKNIDTDTARRAWAQGVITAICGARWE